VKYGAQGQTVTVTAQCEADVARIAIDDEGSGVPAEHLARIWQPFYRIPSDTTVGGTGIGLAIVKQLVDLHRGHVSVESRESGGARFVVALPGASCVSDPNERPAAALRA
jgi:signal transduction histidine kinase